MLRESACLCKFRTATEEEVEFVGYSFVDVADKVVTSPNPTATYKEIAELLKKSADTWEGGVEEVAVVLSGPYVAPRSC